MHKVFCIPELVELILESVVGPDGRIKQHDRKAALNGLVPDAANDVKAVGLTAKIFREASLNILWHTQHSLVPLFCSVGIVIKPHRPGRLVNQMRLTRPLNAEDLPTIRCYSTRIRSLELPFICQTALIENDVQAILPSCGILFPRLQTLSCVANNLAEMELVIGTLGHALRDLSLATRHVLPARLVDILVERSPGFRSLRVTQFGSVEDNTLPTDALSSMLSRASHLSRLDLEMTDELWLLAACSSHLTYINAESFMYTPSPSPAQHTFSALTTLKLEMLDVPRLSDLLQHSKFPSLQSLDCAFSNPSPNCSHIEILTLISAIADSCIAATLTRVAIGAVMHRPETSESDSVMSDALRPLLRHQNMREFVIRSPWSWDLDNALIVDIAHSWNEIEVLILSPNNHWPSPSRITLVGLEPLALHCPQLAEFGAIIDTSAPLVAPDFFNRMPIGGKWSMSLQTLAVDCSPIDSPAVVAFYLSRMFPNVNVIEAFQSYDDEDEDDAESDYIRWARVLDILPTMVLARIEERLSQMARAKESAGVPIDPNWHHEVQVQTLSQAQG